MKAHYYFHGGLAWGQSDLSIKEEAVLDAKGDAKKWLAYPPLALISAGGLATATFFIGEDIYDGDIVTSINYRWWFFRYHWFVFSF